MDALMRGSAFLDFEESPDLHAPMQCLPIVTAALLAGFQLGATDGGKIGNFEHCYVGPTHPRNFKTAKRSQVMRIMAFRFKAGHVSVFGVPLRIEEFIHLYRTDATARAHFESLPTWDKSLAIMQAKLKAAEPVVKAGYDHRRNLIIPLRPVDPESDKGKIRAELLMRFEG
jgi:hypothetical protein